MGQGVPRIQITKKPGYGQGSDNTDRIWGICIETNKGEPFTPTLVTSPNQMYDDFKTSEINGYWGVGGGAIYVVRVTAGTPVAAEHKLLDTAATGANVMNLKAKEKGSYEITFSAASTPTGGSSVIINEEGFSPEYYLGVQTITELVSRINRYSRIVTAEFVAEGTGRLSTVVSGTVIGSGSGNTVGSDGKTKTGVDTPADEGELHGDDVVAAHQSGLVMLENYDIKGVFTISNRATVQDSYAQHAKDMTTPRINKWRYACIGASTEDTTKAAILGRTAGYDDECVLFVGQGLIAYDSSGNRIEYPPSKATQAVAGKRSHLKYNEPMFGGEDKKLLSYNGTGFFVDIMPMIDETVTTTDDDYDEYNEKGVITFIKEIDGVRIKEGVTTVQPSNTNMQSMESVVNIVFEACRIMTKKSREMFGRGISNTFKTDLEQHVGQGLEEMKSTDYSLIDLPDEQLQAYTVEAVVTPRSRQRRGEVLLSASIVPVYAARQIDITLTVL